MTANNKPLIAVIYAIYYFTFGYFYLNKFHDSLIIGEWLNINGFTRVVIPDTFRYFNLGENDFSDVGSVKNSFIPALLWFFLKFNWYRALWLNFLINIAAFVFISKILDKQFISKERKTKILVLILFNPGSLYYSLGVLKEPLTLLFLLSSLYYFLNKKWLYFVTSCILLVLVRFQFLYFLLFLFTTNLLKIKRCHFMVFLFLMLALFPLWRDFMDVYNSAGEIYRENMQQGYSLGGYVELIRDKVPILSGFGVVLRMIQSVFEPFLSIGALVEQGALSVFSLVQLISLIFFAPSIFLWFRYFFLSSRSEIEPILQMIFLFIVVVGGLSFIHHRYLYPIIILMLIMNPLNYVKRKS